MEYKRLSELDAVTTLEDLALVPVVQAGANYRATVGQVRAGLATSGHTHAAASQSAAGFLAAADKAKLDGIEAGATLNASDAALRDRATHTGTQTIATVAGLQTALDGKSASGHGHAAGEISGLAAVATSGDYNDLINKPSGGGGGSGGPAAFRNLILNGGCAVSHRGSKTLSTSWVYAEVDLIAVRAEGTVGAGTIKREANPVSSLGTALKLENVTLTGSGALGVRVRIEARDAVRLKAQAAVFSAKLWHNCGGARSLAITLNKPTVADTFSTVTQIATGASSVADQTTTAVTCAVTDMGDCANGIEVLLRLDTGAISGRTVYLADLQLEAGTTSTVFETRPVAVETTLVHRYLRPITSAIGVANSATNVQLNVSHPGLRAAPAYSPSAPLKITDMVSADYTQSQANIGTVHNADAHGGRFDAAWFSGLKTRDVVALINGGVILASAEL